MLETIARVPYFGEVLRYLELDFTSSLANVRNFLFELLHALTSCKN